MSLARWKKRNTAVVVGLVVVALVVGIKFSLNQQKRDSLHQTRRSFCQPPQFQGTPLAAQQTDAGVHGVNGHLQRVLSYSFDASPFVGGEIYLCAEYGRIEILDSDDTQARLEIRLEASAPEAAKILNDATMATSFTSNGDRLSIGAWRTMPGHTSVEQPTWTYIRLTVPVSGSYSVDATASHGGIGVHQLTLERGKLSGFVRLQQKSRQGYVGGHDLDHVSLRGDLDVNMTDGPIAGTLYTLSSSRVRAQTNRGDIQLYFAADPAIGFDVAGGTNQGAIKVDIGPTEIADDHPTQYLTEYRARSQGYAEKPIQVQIEAATLAGNIVIAIPK